jgi:hypothetical protein
MIENSKKILDIYTLLQWPKVLHICGRFFCIFMAENSALCVASYTNIIS